MPERMQSHILARDSQATELVESNVPLPVVQKQLRHADVATTLRVYSHAISETHRNVMEQLAQRTISALFSPIGRNAAKLA